MNLTKYLVLFILCAFASSKASADLVEWVVTPKYDEIKPYSKNVFLIKDSGKWGLMSTSGEVILSPTYDAILPLSDGHAVVCNEEYGKYKIELIYSQNGMKKYPQQDLYLTPSNYSQFSENKLPVQNAYGKCGYMNTSGEIVIRCQFLYAHPFSQGWASVMKDDEYVIYISENYDRNKNISILPVDYNYGEMTFASTFSNGKAVVGHNGKFAEIGLDGHKIRNVHALTNDDINWEDYSMKMHGYALRKADYHSPQKDMSVTTWNSGSETGYLHNDNLLVFPCFESAGEMSVDGYAVVGLDGRQGLIHKVKGNIRTFFTAKGGNTPLTSFKVNGTSKLPECDMCVEFPSVVDVSKVELYVDLGKGRFSETPVRLKIEGNKVRYTFQPYSNPKAVMTTVNYILSYDGLIVWSNSSDLYIERANMQQRRFKSKN